MALENQKFVEWLEMHEIKYFQKGTSVWYEIKEFLTCVSDDTL